MKITGIVGSPREDGSTIAIVENILNGAKENGYDIHSYYVNNLDINPCQACYHCREHKKCKFDDDMLAIIKDLDESDVFIIGSPIYFGEVTGQLKTLIDRFYSITTNRKINGTKLVLVYVQANPDKSLFKKYIENQNFSYNFMGFEVVDTLQVYGIREKEDLIENKVFLEKAKEIGFNL
jgi:multimeric flavodoxin WrbA